MDVLCRSTVVEYQHRPLGDSSLKTSVRRTIAAQRPELHPDSPSFQAAVLLLSAVQIGQNVDRLARLTELPRDFVARCARRLVDNGVWRGGRTIRRWNEKETLGAAFWSDVAVAEGRLCRREDEDGVQHWAPPGQWRKSYGFMDRESAQDTRVSYEIPEEAPEVVEEPAPERRAQVVAEEEESPEPAAPPEPVAVREPVPVAPVEPKWEEAECTATCSVGLATVDLFPGANWLC